MSDTRGEQSAATWWSAGLRVLQFNWSREQMEYLDVDQLVEVSLQAQANAVIVNGGGIFAWYPTDVPFHHADPEARAKDPLGRCVAACKAAGLRVIPRVDFSRNAAGAIEHHPDWFVRDAAGNAQDFQSTQLTCSSSPYRNGAYAELVLREIAERYEIDGFHLNGGGQRGFCYCEYCQAGFASVAGAPIPAVADWDDPLWLRFLTWRRGSVAANIGYLADVIHSIDPGLFFMGEQMGPGKLGYVSAMYPRDLAGKFSTLLLTTGEAIPTARAAHSPWWVGMAAKCAQVTDGIQPVMNLKASLREADWPRVTLPPSTYRFQNWQALANNAGLKLPALGSLALDDTRTLPPIRDAFGRLAAQGSALSGARPLADVALVWPVRSALLYGREDFEQRVHSHFYGTYNLLVRSHIPFAVIDEESITECDLSAYRAVVLPNVATLSAAECKALEAYVAGGGGLVASFQTGCIDPDAPGDLSDPGCRGSVIDSLLGVVRGGLAERGRGYARLEPAGPLAGAGASELVPHAGPYVRCRLEPGSTAIMHFAESRDIGGSSERWEPPLLTEEVLGSTREFGSGRVVYFATKIDSDYWSNPQQDWQALLASAVRWAAGGSIIRETNARASVELTLFHTRGDGLAVHLVNSTGLTPQGEPAEPVTGIEILLDEASLPPGLGSSEHATASTFSGVEVGLERRGGELRLRLERLDEFDTVLVRRAPRDS